VKRQCKSRHHEVEIQDNASLAPIPICQESLPFEGSCDQQKCYYHLSMGIAMRMVAARTGQSGKFSDRVAQALMSKMGGRDFTK
jgi:hypothetical protein